MEALHKGIQGQQISSLLTVMWSVYKMVTQMVQQMKVGQTGRTGVDLGP
jgi:hypothetical protein